MTLVVIGLIFFVTIIIGVPVAFGMGLAGATWILFFEGMEPTILARRFYYALSSFPLLAIPLFIMLGILADRAQMLPQARRLAADDVRAGRAAAWRTSTSSPRCCSPGISGTAVSDIASLGRMLIQMMTRAGYPVAYSAALTAATAIIAPDHSAERGDDHLRARRSATSRSARCSWRGAIPGVLFGARLPRHVAGSRRGAASTAYVEPWPTRARVRAADAARDAAAGPAGHHRRRHLQRRVHRHGVRRGRASPTRCSSACSRSRACA